MADDRSIYYVATDWRTGTPRNGCSIWHVFDPSVDMRKAFRMTRELATEMKIRLRLMKVEETLHELQTVFPE